MRVFKVCRDLGKRGIISAGVSPNWGLSLQYGIKRVTGPTLSLSPLFAFLTLESAKEWSKYTEFPVFEAEAELYDRCEMPQGLPGASLSVEQAREFWRSCVVLRRPIEYYCRAPEGTVLCSSIILRRRVAP